MRIWVLLPLISIVRGDASVTGNCLSQKIYFNNSRRIFLLDGTPSLLDIKELDPSRYDATIDYHADLVNYLPGGGLSIMLQRPTSGQKYPPAGRVSTTRFIKHGKVSLYVKAPALRGVVTTFIMMGTFFPDPTRDLTNADHQGGDEIDWEIRGRQHLISKPIDSINKYTIDHNHERINFLVNDELVRTYRRIQDSESPIQHKLFYPDRPMKVQFALWSDPDNEWAGGAIKWPNGIENVTAEFRNLEIECYDDQDQIVPKWPLLFNPDYTKEIELQPIRLKEGSIPVEAGPGFQGAIPFISKNELETIDPIATTNYTKKPEFKLHLPFASSSGSFSTFKFVPFTLLLTSFVSCL